MPRPPPPLPEEIVEEILLHLPPDTPASLVRAAAVSKRWCRLVSNAGFRRRFRERHDGTPPVLGFLWPHNNNGRPVKLFCRPDVTSFRPTPSSRLPHADHRGMLPWDARHGRVLLDASPDDDVVADDNEIRTEYIRLIVWDPITGEILVLPPPPACRGMEDCNATVLCAAAGKGGGACDHLECRGGPFTVVLMVTGRMKKLCALVYSSESGAWSGSDDPVSWPRGGGQVTSTTSALVGNGLYFMTYEKEGILKYDLVTRQVTTFIKLPAAMTKPTMGMIRATEDGQLGYVRRKVHKLSLWCLATNNNGVDHQWELTQVIELDVQTIHSGIKEGTNKQLELIGTVEGVRVVFLVVGDALYTLDLKSEKTTKVHERLKGIWSELVPYVTFYTPVLPSLPWNPITGEKVELPGPPARRRDPESFNTTVLCAASAASGECECDHLDCHNGPFIVVLVGTDDDLMFSYMYSSEADTWSDELTSAASHRDAYVGWEHSALVGNQLYFVAMDGKGILEYDLGTRHISVMELPHVREDSMCPSYIELTTTEGGMLGFVRVEALKKLCLWSRTRRACDRWELSNVIQLKKLLPLVDGSWSTMPCLVGSTEGVGVIFPIVKDELFTIDLKSSRVTKIYEEDSGISMVVPYANFYTPGTSHS
ncbi:hypothetical protein QOZ80_7BG0584210 [Eleusine coracana subsp. coracana]|nr:hypothetical protein QOZ80_7BG0584210 [Eleusine coracana subsp. coracana]